MRNCIVMRMARPTGITMYTASQAQAAKAGWKSSSKWNRSRSSRVASNLVQATISTAKATGRTSAQLFAREAGKSRMKPV